MAEFLKTLGESFSDEELTDFMKHATLKKKGTDNFIDIIKLTEVMMPRFSAREEILKQSMIASSQDSIINLTH